MGRITYQAIRALICHAAVGTGTGPGCLSFTSFTTALHAARRALCHGTTAIQAAADEAANHVRRYGEGSPAEIIVVLSGEVAARRGVVLACPAAVIDGD